MVNGTVVSLNGMSRLVLNKRFTRIEKNVGTKDEPIWVVEAEAQNEAKQTNWEDHWLSKNGNFH